MTWYAHDEFWQENYDVMFSEESFRSAAEDVNQLLTLLGAQPHHVLDLCCGPGRHSIPLAQRGVNVTAIDLSSFLLGKAAEKARGGGVSVEWIRADMREFVRRDAFDVILNLSTSFGYFPDREDDLHAVSNMFASLRPGGSVIIDLVGKELVGRRGDRVIDLPDGSTCIQRIAITHEWTMLDSEWILVRQDSVRRYRLSHRLYSGLELRELMEHVGFDVALFGDFAGGAYDASARRLVAVGRKPA